MQHRMNEFTMTDDKIEALLNRALVGRISTVGENGYPYTVSVHYVYDGTNLYFHGLAQGEKLNNIRRCGKVCFEVSEMTSLLLADLPLPCKADTEYESIVITGDAQIINNAKKKKSLLNLFVEKYVPAMEGFVLPVSMINGTALVQINIIKKTGKFH